MVNNLMPRLVVHGACVVRKQARSERLKITNGPVYSLGVAQTFVEKHGLVVMNGRAEHDMENAFHPDLTEDELVQVFLCLRESAHYLESERCLVRANMTVDSDAYRIVWDRRRMAEGVKSGLPVFIKFGFRESNPRCIIVSVHPAKY